MGSSWSSAVLIAFLLAEVANPPRLPAQTTDSLIDFSVSGCACPSCASGPLATICTSQSPNTRVVGRGLVSQGDVDSQGNLLNPQAYWQNGVVARYATVTMSGAGEGPVGEIPWAAFSLKINGNFVGAWRIQGDFGSYPGDVVQVAIPIEWLRFAHRNETYALREPEDGVFGDPASVSPDEVQNDFEVALLDGNTGLAISGSIEFRALDPIVLVHGWRSGPWTWGPAQGTNNVTGCGPRRGRPESVGINFIVPLNSARAPFDCRVILSSEGKLTNEQGAAELTPQVKTVAASFGAQHAHLIGHSKGGLWIRRTLGLLSDQDGVAVDSVVTLSTPHHGSPLADLLVGAYDHPFRTLFPTTLTRLVSVVRAYTGGYDKGAISLQTEEARINNKNILLPDRYATDPTLVSQYRSLGADADGNSDGRIQDQEAAPTNPRVARSLYTFLRRYRSVTYDRRLINGRSGPFKPAFELNGGCQKNDFAVPVSSAHFEPSFLPVPFGASDAQCSSFLVGKNHATLKEPALSSQLLSLLKTIQRVP